MNTTNTLTRQSFEYRKFICCQQQDLVPSKEHILEENPKNPTNGQDCSGVTIYETS
jgi:hypothetical protein